MSKEGGREDGTRTCWFRAVVRDVLLLYNLAADLEKPYFRFRYPTKLIGNVLLPC
jgi:hypothetical protein